jgi:ribonuclease VapC
MTVVLDASAMLAALLDEPGGDVVAAALDRAVISAVNVGEVAAKLARGADAALVRASLGAALPLVVAADRELAFEAGLIEPATRAAGLSFGGRFCLTLARRLGCPALTADRAWRKIAGAVGVEVRLIR